MSNPGGAGRPDDTGRAPDRRRPMPPSIPPRERSSPPSVTPRRVPTRDRRAPAFDPSRAATQPARQGSAPQLRRAGADGRGSAGGTRGNGGGGGAGTGGTEQVRRPAVRKRHRLRTALLTLVILVVVALGGFWWWVEGKINHVDALSGAPGTPGQTYLIVGSDSREGWMDDGTVGARTDTIMLLHQPESGPTALISIPRDSYVEIPGYGGSKINAAFAYGGPKLLVQTVEQLSGFTIDRYVEVGFLGVTGLVDAVGGVELCYDADVNDPYSTLVWQAGCHQANGATALAFSRMRYADPEGDIGRTARQQQVVSAVAEGVMSPSTILNPTKLIPVASTGLDSFRVSDGTGAFDLLRMALVVNGARGTDTVTGTPPIASIDYRVEGVGSTVLLDPGMIDEFWSTIANGGYAPGTQVGGIS